MLTKISLSDKFDQFQEQWSPKIVAELNGQHVKIAKIQGDFIWHSHEHEDELFWVVKGTLFIEFRSHTEELQAGEIIVVPKGVEHRPFTKEDEEVHIMMFEPMGTLNTGNVENDRTKKQLDHI